MAGLRRKRSARDTGDFPSLGFLDVNFGVLGIFIVIFAIRILLIQSQSAYPFDVLVVVQGDAASEQGLVQIYTPSEVTTIEETISRLYEPDNELGTEVKAFFQIQVAQTQSPLKVGFILLPDGFDTMKAITSTISARAFLENDDFLPLEYAMIPSADAQAVAEIIAAWEEGNG